jgi:Ala-tRNA(Pro) deacylase
MTTHTAPDTLIKRLAQEQIPYELIPHRRTDTAVAEADALHVDPSQVAKTIVLTTPTGFVLAVLPASERLDLHKVRDLLGTKDVSLSTEQVLAGAYPEFELGAVPPIGAHGDRVLIDLRLCENEFVLVEAGTHEESLRLETADLITLSSALVADLCRDASGTDEVEHL